MTQTLSPNIKLIGRYPILRELRRDRHTVVYLALDPVLNRELLVKAVQLRPSKPEERAAMARVEQAFMRQAQAAGRLQHAHIVMVFDGGLVNNIGYLALEKVDGKLLEDLLVEGYRPGILQAADIAARVADAVEFAHARGIPHGHLSPSRIYLQNADHMPKVMGFGGWIDSGATGDFELQGTASMLPYFGSELGAEARRKDVRALGALLFLLLTGARPDIKTLRARGAGGESPILRINPKAPPALAEVAEDALELRGSRPFTSAAQVRNALTAFLWAAGDEQAPPKAASPAGKPASAAAPRPAGKPLTAGTAKPAPHPAPVRNVPARARPATRALPISAAKAPAPSLKAVFARWQRFGYAALGLIASVALGFMVWNARSGTERTVATHTSEARPGQRPVVGARFSAPPPSNATGVTGPGTEGTVTLAVAPGGEVFVNGASYGRTPPLTELRLPVGRHRIEVRAGDDANYVAQVDVTTTEPKHIRYQFQ